MKREVSSYWRSKRACNFSSLVWFFVGYAMRESVDRGCTRISDAISGYWFASCKESARYFAMFDMRELTLVASAYVEIRGISYLSTSTGVGST